MTTVITLLKTGFEEIEALTIVDYLRRADIEVKMVSTTDDIYVTGDHGIVVKADMMLEDLDEAVDFIFIPGGMPGAEGLRDDEKVQALLRDHHEQGHPLAAICAGPIALERAGILEGKKATSYPGIEKELKSARNYLDELVVVDENVITSRGPSTAVYLALALIELIKGSEKKEEIKKDILLNLVEEKIKEK